MGEIIIPGFAEGGELYPTLKLRGAVQAGLHFKDKGGIELKIRPESIIDKNCYFYLSSQDVDSILAVLGLKR